MLTGTKSSSWERKKPTSKKIRDRIMCCFPGFLVGRFTLQYTRTLGSKQYGTFPVLSYIRVAPADHPCHFLPILYYVLLHQQPTTNHQAMTSISERRALRHKRHRNRRIIQNGDCCTLVLLPASDVLARKQANNALDWRRLHHEEVTHDSISISDFLYQDNYVGIKLSL
jgi:hypothetical protein